MTDILNWFALSSNHDRISISFLCLAFVSFWFLFIFCYYHYFLLLEFIYHLVFTTRIFLTLRQYNARVNMNLIVCLLISECVCMILKWTEWHIVIWSIVQKKFFCSFFINIQNQAKFKSIHKCTTIKWWIWQQQTSREKKTHAKPLCLIHFFLPAFMYFFLLIKFQKQNKLCINELIHLWWDRIRNSFARTNKIPKKLCSGFFRHHFFLPHHPLYHHHQAHSFYAHTHWLWLIKIHWLISYNYYFYWLIHNLKSIGRAEEFKTHSIMLLILLTTYHYTTLHNKHTHI